MRHVGSVLLALIFAPAIFLLTDLGLSGVDAARQGSFTDDPLKALVALGTLFLAGLIYGVLVMARLSPIGPGFAGLALMGTSSWAVLDPASYYETLGKIDIHMRPLGLGMLLGAPLVATLTSPRRWRTGNNEPADPGPPAQPSTLDLRQALPESKTLPDFVRARAPVTDLPNAKTVSLDVPVPLPHRLPTVPPGEAE